jgi:hypothetical protein
MCPNPVLGHADSGLMVSIGSNMKSIPCNNAVVCIFSGVLSPIDNDHVKRFKAKHRRQTKALPVPPDVTSILFT